ncbi:hypothetical protein HGP05_10045 [Streptococcus sanguinis]|uniref:Uncharacterized protein n=1 Tax=Streptococcus sanguinis TaxID=1305 RepID=A0A7Y0VBP5_STRSA|nr:hypothetical protein [Streptococcus sanguinis]
MKYQITNYGTTPDTAPVLKYQNQLTTALLQTTPVHEVPESTNYGTTPDTAPVHEVPELELTTANEIEGKK